MKRKKTSAFVVSGAEHVVSPSGMRGLKCCSACVERVSLWLCVCAHIKSQLSL